MAALRVGQQQNATQLQAITSFRDSVEALTHSVHS